MAPWPPLTSRFTIDRPARPLSGAFVVNFVSTSRQHFRRNPGAVILHGDRQQRRLLRKPSRFTNRCSGPSMNWSTSNRFDEELRADLHAVRLVGARQRVDGKVQQYLEQVGAVDRRTRSSGSKWTAR